MSKAPDGELELWRGTVLPEWLDYNGHMTEHRYLQAFGESSDALYAWLGVDFNRAEDGAYYTLETHIRHRREVRLGAALRSATEVLGYDDKRLHLLHRLFGGEGQLLATGEHLAIHVAHGRSCPASALVLNRLAAAFALHMAQPLPAGIGSVLAKPLRFMRAPAVLNSLS